MILFEAEKYFIDQLIKAGVETPHLDIGVIISYVLNIERYRLIIDKDRELSEIEMRLINKFVSKRIAGEPIAYIIGKKEFYSLDFKVNKHVIIPRPETELLVDLGIYYSKRGGKGLDLGTGSGAIAIALKKNRNDMMILASDISEKALKVAKNNAHLILKNDSIKFFQGDLFDPFCDTKFDIIISNPPYIDVEDKDSIQREITFEPEIALFCNDHGKAIIKRIINDAREYLNVDGIMLIEIGSNMKNFIQELGNENNYNVSILNDYSSIPRVVVLKRKD